MLRNLAGVFCFMLIRVEFISRKDSLGADRRTLVAWYFVIYFMGVFFKRHGLLLAVFSEYRLSSTLLVFPLFLKQSQSSYSTEESCIPKYF